MAKLGKINLRGLLDTGKISGSLNPSTVEDANSDGFGALFDGRKTDSTFFGFYSIDDLSLDSFTIHFIDPLPIKKIRLKTSTQATNGYNIFINENNPSGADNFYIVSDNTTVEQSIFDLEVPDGMLRTLRYNLTNSIAGARHNITEIEIEILELSESDEIEFNDSVLDSLAWKSSRYNGRQLSGSGVNVFNAGDISYGKTPVIRNNSRTFYVANEIVSLGIATSGSKANFLPVEDNSLQFIPNFSYILVNKSITVNGDNTISERDLGIAEDNEEQRGMQREFQSNVKIGDNIRLINFDSSIRNRSNSKYKVYFNRGRLQPFLRLLNLDPNDGLQGGLPDYNFNGDITLTAASSGNTKLKAITKNKDILQRFFTGSFDSFQGKTVITREDIDLITEKLFEDKATTGKPFISYLKTSASEDRSIDRDFEPIRTIESPAGIFKTENLAELSTIELLDGSGATLSAQTSSPLNQEHNVAHGNPRTHLPFPDGFYSGSIDLSILNEEKPALLVNMNKETELPDGKGSKPIIVIPSNLHPFVRDNITHFCAKAGLDIGDRKVVPDLNNRFANLL
jgi:hypothetical protein